MNILIDADGCPVVDLTLQIAKRFVVPVIILCDTAHQIEREGAQTLVFDKGADSVDFALVNRVKPGDVVVTQDYGLASMCLAKCARVLNQNGLEYTADNMEALMLRRYENKKLLRAGKHPKGTIVLECGQAMLKNGYKVKILNTINFKKSMHYNPFSYVHSEKDILKLVTTLMTNTKGEGSGGDPFWEKSERLLLTALIAYLHYEAPVEEQNFATLLEMLNTMQVLEDDEEYQNPVDLLFEELAKKKPNSFAGRQYKLYKLAAGKTAKSILISCGARLAPFDIQELRDLTMYDELQLDTLGDKKTALFLIMSDTDSTFNFLISMVYTQLFNLLCDKADDQYGGKLPVHVRCLIDECANIGQIPQLEKLVATIRSREISACLVLQARSQLKAIYKDNADTIVGNMDSQIFLGGSEPTTLKDLSEMLGKETIDAFNTSDTRGNSPSYGTTFQKMGHELLSRDELAVLDGGKCILQLRGVRPFLSDKYDLTQHPNYKLTSDYDPKNTFDIEKYLNRKEKIHPGDEFIVVDADSLPSA